MFLLYFKIKSITELIHLISITSLSWVIQLRRIYTKTDVFPAELEQIQFPSVEMNLSLLPETL
jgi:hypothetical protein